MDSSLLTLGSFTDLQNGGFESSRGFAQMTDWITGPRALTAHRCSLQVLGDVNGPQRHTVLTN